MERVRVREQDYEHTLEIYLNLHVGLRHRWIHRRRQYVQKPTNEKKKNLLYTIDTNYSNELIKWGEFQRMHKARADNNKNDISIRLPLKIWHILWKYILTSSPSLFSPAFFLCISDGHSSQISFDVWKFKTHKLSGWALHMKWICYEYLICITFHKNK